MRAVLQRVKRARVDVSGRAVGEIGFGLLILLGVMDGDGEAEARMLADKISRLRIFSDESGRLNRSLLDVGGSALIVSNFTLAANYTHGNRPDYFSGAAPDAANALYLRFIELLGEVLPCASGEFGADMQLDMLADGPVTIVMDTDVLKQKRR